MGDTTVTVHDAVSAIAAGLGGTVGVAALAVIVLVSPVLALAGLAVKLTSPGPLLFRQERTGRVGCPFSALVAQRLMAPEEAVPTVCAFLSRLYAESRASKPGPPL